MIQLQNLSSASTETLRITATIETALCVGAGGSSGSLADKPIIRNAEGRLLIPASQLKGRLRHECEKLARGLGWPVCESPNPQTMCPQRARFSDEKARRFEREDYQVVDRHHCIICQIFGNPTLPSRLFVDDLICTEDPDNLTEVLRPGVTLNRARGTAEDKKLYLLETSPVNAQLQFSGDLHLYSPIHTAAKALIMASLKHIHALGGSKSSGLGWLQWEWDTSQFSIDDIIWTAIQPKSYP